MGQKDITEKLLEDYNDVFADIINGLIFKGEQRILPESLENAKVHSQYKAEDGKVHELERDVIKYWKEKKVELAICGIENQSNVKKYMPFRIIGYDGAAYRSQLLENRKEILPVMTIVLYFGTDHHWYGKKNIKGLMKIPEGLEEYINDYEMKVFEIAWLTEEEISRFHSDFKVVANFFVQKRKHKDYIPDDPTEIRHIDEVLKLLRVMTGDERYQAIFQKERGVHSMCDVAERLEKMGMEKGIEKGMEQGVKQGRKLGRNEGIHEEKIRVYKKLLEKGFSKQEAQEITELSQFLENCPSLLKRGMLLVRRARRWALRKLICKIVRHDESKTIHVKVICFWIHHGCIILHTMFYNAVHLHMQYYSFANLRPLRWEMNCCHYPLDIVF